MIWCVTCGEGHPTANPHAWLEHTSSGGHIFHPWSYAA